MLTNRTRQRPHPEPRLSATALAGDFPAYQRTRCGAKDCSSRAFAARIDRPADQGPARCANNKAHRAVGPATIGAPVPAPADDSVAGWTAQLEQALTQTMDDLAHLSKMREPAPFVSLVHGGAGVGGIYDMYRRGRAWAAGRRFDAAHEPRKAGE